MKSRTLHLLTSVVLAALLGTIGEARAALSLTPSNAVSITRTNATLYCGVSNTETSAAFWFYWGTNNQSTNATLWAYTNALGASSSSNRTTTLSNLTASTTYYWIAYATNGATSAWSSVTNFTTLTVPSAVYAGVMVNPSNNVLQVPSASAFRAANDIAAQSETVTNRGAVLAAGANVTLNGGTDPVSITNGVTITVAATLSGGGITSADFSNLLATVASTGTYNNATTANYATVAATATNANYAAVAANATNAEYATSAGTSATASNWTGAAAMSNNLLGTVIPTSQVAAASWSAVSGVASNLAPGTPSNTLAAAVTNRGVVFAAGANITLNGGSDPVYSTNGATITIAATLGGGGITSSDFSNLLATVASTGTYNNATTLDGVTRANLTNGFVKESITNALDSVVSVDSKTNAVYILATNAAYNAAKALTNGFDTVVSVDNKTNAVYILATNAAYSAAKPLTNGFDTVASVDAKTNTLRQWTESRVNDATQTIAGASVSGSVPSADNAVSANSANVALAVGDGYDVSIVTPVGAYATSGGSPTGNLARFDRRTLFGNWTNTGDFRVIGTITSSVMGCAEFNLDGTNAVRASQNYDYATVSSLASNLAPGIASNTLAAALTNDGRIATIATNMQSWGYTDPAPTSAIQNVQWALWPVTGTIRRVVGDLLTGSLVADLIERNRTNAAGNYATIYTGLTFGIVATNVPFTRALQADYYYGMITTNVAAGSTNWTVSIGWTP